MKKQLFSLLVVFILLNNSQSFGQIVADTSKTLRVETIDGNIFVGTVISENGDFLLLKTENLGEINIPQKNIKSKTELKELKKVGNEFWLPNPQSSRYYWAPNGYGLKKGEGYYQNIWVLYNQVSVGVTDNFSVGAGMLPFFLFGGPTPVWIVPKFSIPVVKDKINLGTGAFLGSFMGGEGGDGGGFGLLYGTSTFGSRDKNVSLGVAYGFAGGDWMNIPIINLSTIQRVGPRGYFISENYLIPVEGNTIVVVSLGGRTIVRNIGIDYSLWMPFGFDSFVAIPFLGVSIPLGRKK
jgi:hypothetical protein